jgi:putative ABC transport system ATP-binding protein
MQTNIKNRDLPNSIDEPVVILRGLTKTFSEGKGQRLVLNNLDCEFLAGNFTAVLGKSGSGKSTLLNLISGIEKPSDGDVVISGLKINKLRDRDRTLFRRDNIGFIFQFFNLIPTLTVLENITLPQELAGLPLNHGQRKARTILEAVGLADRERAFPDTLSGGEQQRVAIARALVHNPLLILADEPIGNLDEETGATVLSMLLKLTKSEGRTLIMATHNTEIASLADRVLTLVDGQLVAAD